MKLAIHFYTQAAEKGSIEAMMNLAKLYEHGYNGVDCSFPADPEMAIKYYERAVQYGKHVEAMFRLGVICCNKKDHNQHHQHQHHNMEKGIHFYELACQSQHVPTLCNLGVIYAKSKRFTNIEKAVSYLHQASQSGNLEATFNVGVLYATGQGQGQGQGRETIPIDMMQAIQYYERAAHGGYVEAMYNLGVIYHTGYKDTVAVNIPKAKEYYKHAIVHGHVTALLTLAYLYDHHMNDVMKAVEYYQQSIEKGNTMAFYNLALLYDVGKDGILQSNVQKAIEYYELAANNAGGQTQAWYNLATINTYGQGPVEIDMEKAMHYYGKAVDEGDVQAMYNLGVIYAYRLNGFVPDTQKALSLWQQGATYTFLSSSDSATPLSLVVNQAKNKKKDLLWTTNWCRYKLGELYQLQNQFELARDMFHWNM